MLKLVNNITLDQVERRQLHCWINNKAIFDILYKYCLYKV